MTAVEASQHLDTLPAAEPARDHSHGSGDLADPRSPRSC